jgi:hypothetical protein
MEADRAIESQLQITLRKLSSLRLVAFLVLAGPLLLLETTDRSDWIFLLGTAGLGALAFLGLIVQSRRNQQLLRTVQERIRIHGEMQSRRTRNWDAIPIPDLGIIPDGHPWALDLDIAGPASLAQLLGTPRTLPGLSRLRDALLDPESLSQGQRQRRREAMDCLAQHPDLLVNVQVAAALQHRSGSPEALARFLAWAEGPPWRTSPIRRRWLLAARTLALLNLALVALWFSGAPPAWILGAALSLLISFRIRPQAHPRFDAVEGADASLGAWSGLLEMAAQLPPATPLLKDLREGASSPAAGAAALQELRKLADWAEIRQSSLVYFPLALLLAWDLHPLLALERWRETHGSQARDWVEAVGELELLTALAVLRFNHPDWTLPEEDPAGEASHLPTMPPLEAKGLKHPLLPPDRAVGNDLVLPAPGGLLLVTGSNMSGKSTLLRAVGVNQVLLLAGGPVAASQYRAHPLPPATCMRIQDSLTRGVSLFMAELERLRDVVRGAQQRPVLVLLDEILQGTNSAERRVAARTILTHLLKAGAVGAVSTHDLSLADAPSLARHLVQVHLREEVQTAADGARTLTFDHRLRKGPATSKNALVLLEIVGLAGDELPDPVSPDGLPPGDPTDTLTL